MNRKLSPSDAKQAYQLISLRDGEKCNHEKYWPEHLGIPSEHPCKGKLILDHIDNDETNNVPSNWQILCMGHNGRKNPRGPSRRGIDARHKILSLRENKSKRANEQNPAQMRIDDMKPRRTQSAEMEKNRYSEPRVRKYIVRTLRRDGRRNVVDLVNAASEYGECSQQTTKKYLDKLCSEVGPCFYIVIEKIGYVELRTNADDILDQQVKNWKEE